MRLERAAAQAFHCVRLPARALTSCLGHRCSVLKRETAKKVVLRHGGAPVPKHHLLLPCLSTTFGAPPCLSTTFFAVSLFRTEHL